MSTPLLVKITEEGGAIASWPSVAEQRPSVGSLARLGGLND
ncbi:MAG TPA: hypothetical protein V6C88_00290 [Chroococcidiopsis sp.]